MPKPTHEHIEKLLRELVLPFYHIHRDMPLPVGERRLENDAEHSWSLGVLACSLAPEIDATLDVGKIAQLALAHDLVEVHAGDTSTFADASEHATKAEREEAALEKIAADFPMFPWIAQTIREYESRETNEAKFIYALDKYIALIYDFIDKGRLFQRRKVTLKQYNDFLVEHRKKAHTHPVVAEYYEEVRGHLDAHPEYFHIEVSA